jgi:uncharacterized protein (DUF2252 family)
VKEVELAPNITAKDAFAFGRSLRRKVPRSQQGKFSPAADRDPIAILQQQNAQRLKTLVPVRIGRMLESPFAYYRGAAGPMASDLASDPWSGFTVFGCGDAHVGNFGLYAAPDRRVVFDLNDFDEAGTSPWEWDVKRMACSVEIGCRSNGISPEKTREAVLATVREYRERIAQLCFRPALERYYSRVDYELLLDQLKEGKQRKALDHDVSRARKRTSERVLKKITTDGPDGETRIVAQPPILQRIDGYEDRIRRIFDRYTATLRPDLALLLSQYTVVDYALRVVGVGSVGTRCFIILLSGPVGGPLFLQLKEALPSVLETYGGIRSRSLPGLGDQDAYMSGYRVVSCQQTLQAASDPFLGWARGDLGFDYYIRQFKDMKGSVDLASLDAKSFRNYGRLCAALLARAHSQSPGSAAIAGYIGKSDGLDKAVASWSREYANQVERDFAELERSVQTGRLPAETGV